MIEITVVTPTIPGREHFLEEAKASVAAQTLQPVAHLVELDEHFDGPGPMMNRLVPACETEWVSILADDDLYDPDHLETLAAHGDEADIVLSWSRMSDGRDQYRGPFNVFRLLDRKDTGMRGCFMFRRSLYDDLGGWPETQLEDWMFLAQAAAHGARFVPVYRETWTYRQHPGSVSAAVSAVLAGEQPEQLFHLVRYV